MYVQNSWIVLLRRTTYGGISDQVILQRALNHRPSEHFDTLGRSREDGIGIKGG
jgi:hypothetical protein